MKLYLICGKARAGKDTFANLIKQEEEKNNKKVCILKLTAPLYRWAEDYFGYDKRKDEKPRELLQTLGYDILQLKLKKKDLKDMTGIGSTTMSKLINNEPVSMAVMIKICIALKCNIGDVMDVIL